MKSLLIIAALTITSVAMANTNNKAAKAATNNNTTKTEALSLEQIAKKAQSTGTILGQSNDDLTASQVNDTNRLNTKEAALDINTNSAKK